MNNSDSVAKCNGRDSEFSLSEFDARRANNAFKYSKDSKENVYSRQKLSFSSCKEAA